MNQEQNQSTANVISVRGLGKCYHIYERPLDRLLQGVFGRWHRFHRSFWALRGVDLEMRRGETVGIIGKNGSGKSTLLQVIAGTLAPTEGDVGSFGRVAALLELGSGFDPEFSGRENVFLNAAVLGLRRDEIQRRFPRIEAFAELGDFIDQPTRTYSSGMVVRLAFAVAINTDPDILIIDEALAVGDEAFQRKCYARIDELKQRGTTILFVSHAPSSIVELCDRAVLLDGGERLLTGRPKAVVSQYQRLLYSLPGQKAQVREEILALDRSGEALLDSPNPDPAGDTAAQPIVTRTVRTGERHDAGLVPSSTVELPGRGAWIYDAHLENLQGERVNVLLAGADYVYTYEVEFTSDARRVIFGMLLKSITGIELFGMASHSRGEGIEHVQAGARFRVEFRFSTRLQPGVYFINAGCMAAQDSGEVDFLHRIFDAVMFRIELPETDRYSVGFYDLALEPACRWTKADVGGGTHV